MSSPSFQNQIDAENRAEAIDIAITASDFTTAADLYESFEKWDSVLAKQFYDALSPADQAKLRTALEKYDHD